MPTDDRVIGTLQQFYTLMNETRTIRCRIVRATLEGAPVHSEDLESLESALTALKAIPRSDTGAEVALDEDRKIAIDLSYEIGELEKDLVFITQGETVFESYLSELHPALAPQVADGVEMLAGIDLKNFITDRDGTVNNYCGRYLSSIQSVYNSVYITRFARACTQNTVVLTSAPLENGGLVDITTIPQGTVINAGSKGREFRDLNFERGTLDIPDAQQQKLDQLNARIAEILREPRYEKFGLIGSAFQRKFGQTTIARQDVTRSVPDHESQHFLQVLRDIVDDLDPEKKYFRIEDTGLDVEIILTVPAEGMGAALTDFSKGNGVGFLNERLRLGIEIGPNLVCGDTGSDVPMLEECLSKSPDTWSIFVTADSELQAKVSSLTEQALFIDEPDILISILNRLAITA